MKYIAVFLIWNILLLLSIQEIANNHNGTVQFCKQSTHHHCCKQPKQATGNDCSDSSCNDMISCTTCGFLISTPILLSPAIFDLHIQTTPVLNIGELSDYHDKDWNPPQV